MKSLKQKLNIAIASGILLILTSSCARVHIKDSEFCGDMGKRGASCFTTLSNKSREIKKEAWDQERFGMVCSTSTTFVEWKKALMKLCNATKRCTKDDKKKIENFSSNLKAIEDALTK